MKPMLLTLTVAAFSLILWPVADAVAQEEKVARGAITELGGASLTVKVGNERLHFAVDRDTRVDVPGGATKTRQAHAIGKSGPHLADVLRVGQAVAVTYKDVPNPKASVVRAIPTLGPAGGAVKTASALRSNGVVNAVGPESLTISGNSGGGAKFTQTFVVGPKTKVIGKGASTVTASHGGRAPFSQLIAEGDRVTVHYHKEGSALRASDVRVTLRK
jgi:hypothetical protein